MNCSHSAATQLNRWAALAVLLTLIAAFGAAPSLARADLQKIDFDTGALNTPVDGQGDISFPKSLGFRPYITEVGVERASSGANVGDIGRCLLESADSFECESFGAITTAVLARTAQKVKLFAGKFNPLDPPQQAELTAFNANGEVVGSAGPTAVDTNFRTALELERPAGDIASFRVTSLNGGDLGIDDVSVTFAEGGAPDFSVSTTTQVVPAVQGQSVEVPVHLSRINGSNGPIEVSLSGLPEGLSAAPVTVPGSQTAATLTLTADPRAPDTNFLPTAATLTADPLGNAEVGPAPRQTTLLVRVASDFELRVNGVPEADLSQRPPSFVGIPDCGAVDVPIQIRRDIAFDRDVTLSLRENKDGASGLPPGLQAEILPGATVPPGGALLAERTLRFRGDPAHLSNNRFQVVLEGRSGDGPDAPTRSVLLTVGRSNPSASFEVVHGTNTGLTPRFGLAGTAVRIHGSGFCPGTAVEVGNSDASVPARLVDPHTIEFNVPRYATGAPVMVIPPLNIAPYKTDNALTIDGVRNTDGFRFDNFAFGSLSLSEFIEAFGPDDTFITINPCWPFGDCRVRTVFVDPIAAIEWGVMGRLPHAHCFGMVIASQQLVRHKVPYRRFVSVGDSQAAHHVFDIPGDSGPNGYTEAFLDAEQVKQYSSEMQEARFRRPKSLQAQLETLEEEFRRHHESLLEIHDKGEGHNLLAYDLEQTPTTATIYTYDPNKPFKPNEDIYGWVHRDSVDSSAISVDKVHKTWEYTISSSPFGVDTWSGGEDGSFWVSPESALPDNPSLPEAGALKTLVLNSVDFLPSRSSSDARFVPNPEPVDSQTKGGLGSGRWISADRGIPLDVVVEGAKTGSYGEALSAPGFVASVDGVSTTKGVRDTVIGTDHSIKLRSGKDRPLHIELADRSSSTESTAVTLKTQASVHGSDTAGLGGGALTYAHDGAPTTMSFSLTAIHQQGGPVTFLSGPITVGRGERLEAKPMDRALRRVRLVIHDRQGKRIVRVLRTRQGTQPRLAVGKPRLRGHRLKVRVRAANPKGYLLVGASLRLLRGAKVVARKALAVKDRDGAKEIVWRLPRGLKHGYYRLRADLRVVYPPTRGSTIASSAIGHRSASLRVG